METLIEPIIFSLVPVVVGLVQVFKGTGLNSKYAPILAIILGMSLATFLAENIVGVVLGGIVVGLMASGLYSGTKTVMTK